jgi:hypothetical protein
MNIDAFLERLDKVTKTTGGWTALCPAHDDHTPSLGISEGKDGRILVKCWSAGCTAEEIVESKGLTMSDLFAGDNGTGVRHGPSKPTKADKAKSKAKKPYATKEAAIKAAERFTQGKYVAEWIYHDAEGHDVFYVARFDKSELDPETGKPRKEFRPIHQDAEGWHIGDPPGLLPLYRLPELLQSTGPVYVTEGEKTADALRGVGLTVTTSAHGSRSAHKTDWRQLAGREVVILPDEDGIAYGKDVAKILLESESPASTKIVKLPDLPPKGDAVEFIASRSTKSAEEIQSEIRSLVNDVRYEAPRAVSLEKDSANDQMTTREVFLPQGVQTITRAGHELGDLLARTERFFNRGGAVVKRCDDAEGLPKIEEVDAASLTSDFETVAKIMKIDRNREPVPAICSQSMARQIMCSDTFKGALPRLNVVTRCPVLIEREGRLVVIYGYDRESGILAAGEAVESMGIDEAMGLLSQILEGFRFATPAHRARALAALVTPALVFGGLLGGRAPLDLCEADESQSGKGYRNKLTAAIYNQKVMTIQQHKGGVGSMEETFNTALICGRNFLSLDNIRGKLDSPAIEMFLTEDLYSARSPYRQNVEIDPSLVNVMMTSNKAEITPDLANRSSCVEIRKQPAGHHFRKYPEGDILDHVRAHQSRYLSAVFAIVEAWYGEGKQKTKETRHDFRQWAQTLDWIIRNLLGAGPLLDGHRETQERITNPTMNWLRDVALEINRTGHDGEWLRAHNILDAIADTEIEIPGLHDGDDLGEDGVHKKVLQAMGRKLAKCFRSGEIQDVDGMKIERRIIRDQEIRDEVKEYRVTTAADATANGDRPAANRPHSSPESGDGAQLLHGELDPCGYTAARAAANDAAIKTLYAANAAIDSGKGKTFEKTPLDIPPGCNSKKRMGTHSRIAATAASPSDETEYEEGEL